MMSAILLITCKLTKSFLLGAEVALLVAQVGAEAVWLHMACPGVL
jgi:hypothetical protein